MKTKMIITTLFFIANLILCAMCLFNVFKAILHESSHINPVMDIGLGIVFAWNAFESFKRIREHISR